MNHLKEMNHLNQPWIFRGYSLVFRGVFQFLFWRFKYLHPRKLTYIPWKLMVGKMTFAFKIIKWSPFLRTWIFSEGVRLDDNDSTVVINTFLSIHMNLFLHYPPKNERMSTKKGPFLKGNESSEPTRDFQGIFVGFQGGISIFFLEI